MKPRPNDATPVFVISVGTAVVFLAAFALITGAEYLLALFLNRNSSILVLAGFAILMMFAVRLWIFDLKRATFYEDKVEISGRGYHYSLGYQKVKKVAKVKALPILTARTQVHIYVEGREKPIVIPWNPSNRQTRSDLFSWLTEKPNLRRFR